MEQYYINKLNELGYGGYESYEAIHHTKEIGYLILNLRGKQHEEYVNNTLYSLINGAITLDEIRANYQPLKDAQEKREAIEKAENEIKREKEQQERLRKKAEREEAKEAFNRRLQISQEKRRLERVKLFAELETEFEAKDAEFEERKRNPLFRGKLIKWVTEDKYSKERITENAFDKDNPDIEQKMIGRQHLISYDGQIYTREQFLKSMYSEYKKYPYKVQFNNDNVFHLSSNQRARLQYHILAQNFELVEVPEQEKDDLQWFCQRHEAETAQRWLNRMSWENGHEKMITFGVALDVRNVKNPDGSKTGKIKGIWCYSSRLDTDKAIYNGVSITWEAWKQGIIDSIQFRRDDLTRRYGDKAKLRENDSHCISALYYQNGRYLTLPLEEANVLKTWLNKYIRNGYTPFPYSGEIPNADLKFTIDFETDIEIVRAYDLKTEMPEYNKEHNSEHNKELGRRAVIKTFERLKGDEWKRKDIISQGLFDKDIKNFLKHDLIENIGWGKYRRILPQS